MVSFTSTSAGLTNAALASLALLLITSTSAAPHSGSQLERNHLHQRRVMKPVQAVGKRTCKIQGESGNTTTTTTTSLEAIPASSTADLPSSTVTGAATTSVTVTNNFSASPSDTTSSSSDLSSLFPVGTASSKWTTCTQSSSALSFADALPVNKGKLPTIAAAPDGSQSLVSYYPQGSINPGNANAPRGGFSFYSTDPLSQTALEQATDITFSYAVWFQEGFEWQLGGKLPGVYGGSSQDVAFSCSGGREDTRDQCFSIRNMWRADGAGELYSYLPTSVSQPSTYCNYPPKSICSPTWGDSVGRGAFTFTAGAWNIVTQRVRLNDVGQANGIMELYLNGVKKIDLSGLTLRLSSDVIFRGIMAQTFFGGSSTPYASPQDQYAYFKDFSLAILQ